MATVYKSKIDTWLFVVLALLIAVSLYTSFKIILGGPPITWMALLLPMGVGIALPTWLVLTTHYTLQAGQLLVSSGPFKWRIPVADIARITPTSNPLSSPALSLDRLRIEYGRDKVLMISPRDKEQFLQELEVLRRGAV